MSSLWAKTRSGTARVVRRAGLLSGPSGGEKLGPGEEAREVWWFVVDAGCGRTVDRVISEGLRPRFVFLPLDSWMYVGGAGGSAQLKALLFWDRQEV